jgi:hypothetical protein
MPILNKLFIGSLFVVFFGQKEQVCAQEVSNFTIQTVDSVSYTLYDYLDNGVPVVLDMFSRY